MLLVSVLEQCVRRGRVRSKNLNSIQRISARSRLDCAQRSAQDGSLQGDGILDPYILNGYVGLAWLPEGSCAHLVLLVASHVSQACGGWLTFG